MRPSPTAGQASLEYIAVISLVTALLLLAAPAVGAPSIASSVARGVRLGLCVVAHDYCHAVDAEADRLPPCTLGRRITGKEGELSVVFFRLGSSDEWTVSLGSDGSVSIVRTKGGSGGLVAGVGIEAPFEIDIGAEASAMLRFQEATAWRFADRDAAKRFISGLPESARQPALWRSAAFGGQVSAAAGLRSAGLDAASLSASARGATGVRRGPENVLTVYGEVSFSAPELKAYGLQVKGLGSGRVSLEYTFVDGTPTQIAFRSVVSGNWGNSATETLRRLDLRDPRNRFVAEPLLGAGMFRPPTPGYFKDLHRVLDWIETDGTIERATYAVSDSSKSLAFTLKAGEELGFSHTRIRIVQRLVEATAKTPGSSRERERFDCLDQLR